MGILNVMGIFGKKNITKITDSAISGIDKLFLTKEEKNDYLKKVAESQIEFLKLTLNENSARSLTRRYLAIIIMSTYVALIIFGVIIWGFNKEWAAYTLTQIKSFSTLTVMVAAFYFGSYALGNYILDPFKKKKK